MKSLIIKAIIMIATFAGISQYMLYIVTGINPFNDLNVPEISLKPPTLGKLSPNSSMQTVYKWVDDNGVTQYTSELPPGHIQSQALELDPNRNIVQATEIPDAEEEKPAIEKPPLALPNSPVYSPDTINTLVNDAKNVQTLLNERYEQQEKALEDL